jgi:hypothetical protein
MVWSLRPCAGFGVGVGLGFGVGLRATVITSAVSTFLDYSPEGAV